ncbi:hypothetical protein AAY473_004596 [Plecturocebus cupreus]
MNQGGCGLWLLDDLVGDVAAVPLQPPWEAFPRRRGLCLRCTWGGRRLQGGAPTVFPWQPLPPFCTGGPLGPGVGAA